MYQFLVRLSCWQKWRLFFCQKYFTKKRQVFFNLEVNTGKKKENNRFGLLFREAFCFGKWYKEKHMEKQKSKTTKIETLPKKWLRQTRAIFQQENSEGRRIFFCNLKQRIQVEEKVARYMLGYSWSSIGARKSSKVLIQYKHLKFALSSSTSRQNLPLLFGRFASKFWRTQTVKK